MQVFNDLICKEIIWDLAIWHHFHDFNKKWNKLKKQYKNTHRFSKILMGEKSNLNRPNTRHLQNHLSYKCVNEHAQLH